MLPAARPSSLPHHRLVRPLALLIALVLVSGVGGLVVRPADEVPTVDLAQLPASMGRVGEARRLAPADERWASSVMLSRADLGGHWDLVDSSTSQQVRKGAFHRLFGVPGPACDVVVPAWSPGSTAMVDTQLEAEEALVLAAVVTYVDAETAAADFAVLSGEAFRECARFAFEQGVTGDELTIAGPARAQPQAPPVAGGDAMGVRFEADFVHGRNRLTARVDVVAVRRGRAVAALMLTTAHAEPTAAGLAELLAGRLGTGP